MAYIGKSPSQGVRQRYYFTATGGETSISGTDDNGKTLVFSDGEYIDVYLNGVLLVAGTDYVTTTANTIGSLAALAASDIVEVVAYDIFSVADTVSASAGGTFSANVSWGDNNKAIFGAGSDLQIWHSGSHSYIVDQGTGNLYLQGSSNIRFQDPSNVTHMNIADNGDISFYDSTGTTQGFFWDASAQNLGIGTTSPEDFGSGHRTLQVEGNSTNGGIVKVCTTSDAEEMIMYVDSTGATVNVISNDPLMFRTNNTERMRIDSSGNVGIGTTNPDSKLFTIGDSGSWVYKCFSAGSGAQNLIAFNLSSGGSAVGSITSNGSSTSYNTTSDHRLKENVTEVTGAADRVKALNPVRFNFISNPDTTVDGFLAHEVADVVPEAVTGTKDAMRDEEYEVTPAVLDDEDNVVTEAVMGTRSVPDYQGIDQSKLVPLLTAALQEALTKIDDLESRLSALETAQ